MRINTWTIGARLCCLTLLPGCSDREAPLIMTRPDPVPWALFEPIPAPEPPSGQIRNEDLLEYALDLREALKRCNADKAAAREARENAP